jgi:hypothetical protein
VSTLARHLCLRAPDKADNRAAAIKAAAELVVELPQWEQEQFVGFVFDLSSTKQVRPVTLSGVESIVQRWKYPLATIPPNNTCGCSAVAWISCSDRDMSCVFQLAPMG